MASFLVELGEGPLTIDFGAMGTVRDFITGKTIGCGPKITIDFRLGETRLFQCLSRL